MGKHKKHEEHVNHERWLVCYADMVTLLFALFVVLYSMGVTELEKISEVAKSIQWAFHIEGSGKTLKEGIHDSGSGGGQIPEAVPIQTGQDGPMEEYLDGRLQEDFQRVTGSSLDFDQVDGTFRITSPLSAWFVGQETERMRDPEESYRFLVEMVSGGMDRVSEVSVRIEAPYVVVGQRGNRRYSSVDLCHARLNTFFRVLSSSPRIRSGRLQTEFRELRIRAGHDWQDVGRVVIEFANGDGPAAGEKLLPDKR